MEYSRVFTFLKGAAISSALGLFRGEGKVQATDLLIAKRLSMYPDSYAHDVLQAIAAKQLMKEGVEISAGQTVQYLITNSESKNAYKRVKPAQLLNANVHYDTRKYLDLLLISAANILSPFGYPTNNLYDLIVHREEQKDLARYVDRIFVHLTDRLVALTQQERPVEPPDAEYKTKKYTTGE